MQYDNPVPVSKKINENYEYIKSKIGIDESFDVGYRELIIRKQKINLFYVNGLCDTKYVVEIFKELLKLNNDDFYANKSNFDIIYNHIVFQQVQIEDDLNAIINKVLAGLVVITVENENRAISIDTRNYPGRSPAEPETEKVVRGSRDGFTENIIINSALTRRRVRDPNLRNELFQVGQYAKTDVCLTYIKGLADEKIVNEIRTRIKNINVNELVMTDKKLEELIVNQKLNPFPKVRYTERPDILAVHLYQGLVGIFVDTSPSVIIAPTTYFEQLQHVEEYRQTPIVGSFLRLSRTLGVLGSIYLVPIWLLLVLKPELLPPQLSYIGPKDMGNVPIVIQILIAEVGIEFLRMAAIHTPTSLSTAMGIVAGILIGQIAVQVGLFSPEVVLYVAVSSLGSYATPSYELSLANKIFKLLIILATAFFKVYGLIISIVLFTIYLALNSSFGKPYLYPLLPFNLKEFLNVFIRVYSTKEKKRK